jgi:thymidylate synthase (FAD)
MSGKVKYFLPDTIGFVERLEVFGSDITVVNAARVSFHKEVDSMTNADRKLLTFLAKHDHVSPFFHPQIRFRLKMPIFVAREWFRHTIGLSRNEVSRRYVDSKAECWIPSPDSIRERDPKAKQGSKDTPVNNCEEVWKIMNDHINSALATYDELLKKGVAPEIARTVLPQSMYTEFIETASLYGYARLCNLRLDPSAQKEIRDYATAIHNIMSDLFPVSWAALSSKFKSNVVANS